MSDLRCTELVDTQAAGSVRCLLELGHAGEHRFFAGQGGIDGNLDRRSKAEKLALTLGLMESAMQSAAMGWGDPTVDLIALAKGELVNLMVVHQRALMRETIAFIQESNRQREEAESDG